MKSSSSENKTPGIIITEDWWQSFDAMSNAAAGEMVKALIAHARGGQEQPTNKALLPLWYPLKEQQERMRVRYGNTCTQRSIAAWKKHHPEDKELSVDEILKKMQNPAKSCEILQLQNAADIPDANGTKQKSKSKSKQKVSKDTYTGIFGKEIIVEKWIYRSIGRLFNRRKSTAWAEAERRKVSALSSRPEILQECREICRFYRSGYEYKRRDIITLLNQWTTELDRARTYREAPPPTSRTVRMIPGAQAAPVFGENQRGRRCIEVKTQETKGADYGMAGNGSN